MGMQEKVAQLTERFTVIDRERMQGLPFYNHNLFVEALDFKEIKQGYIGALITPWFINIILLFKRQPKQDAALGQRINYKLASGEQDFMVGEDEKLGRYDFISLASPTKKFKLQQQARDFAQQKLQQLLNPEPEPSIAKAPIHFAEQTQVNESRRNFLSGKNR